LSRRTLNLGILAHVDAGKTTLTERLLYEAGVIDAVGSVDHGTTQTDSLALERERGITIKAAVVSFQIGDVTVNLIDTPGHPDFIAEVERVLSVLDGAVLVISAVEGVQPQTHLLMRALRRLRVPTLLFVNKIDRTGADDVRVLQAIAERLTPAAVPLGRPYGLGTRDAGFEARVDGDELAAALAENDDDLLAAYVDGDGVPAGRLQEALADQTARSLVYPVLFGAALTGAGVEPLTAAIAALLPAGEGDADAPVSGSVFKVERGTGGEKVAYVRMFAGTVSVRDRLCFGDGAEGKVTAVGVLDHGAARQAKSVSAGEIGKLWGLAEIRIGDAIGDAPPRNGQVHQFAPPTLETVVEPLDPDESAALRLALTQLAEQDPLIDVRQGSRQELSVSLYGDVQKEVIEATLEREYGIAVSFREVTPIYVERPLATGEAVEVLHADTNPYNATIGLRVEPARPGTGTEFRVEVGPLVMPLFVYKGKESFEEHMGGYVRDALREGRYGWRVTDCVVALARCAYSIPDGPPSRRGPPSTAADFRKLTPLVLRQALEAAGTVVCEPVHRFRLDAPAATLGQVLPALVRHQAVPEPPTVEGSAAVVEGDVPAACVQKLRLELPHVTGGEGSLETAFDRYEPVTGAPPKRE